MREFYLPAIAIMAVVASVRPTEIPTCPSKDSANSRINITHESDCTKFYKCIGGVKYEMTCPEKLCFNPERQMCDWPNNVACCKKHRNPHCPSPGDHAIAVWPHPYNCRLYYTCINSITSLRSCDEGSLFDPESLKCKLANEVRCNNPTVCPPAGSSETVLLPHECKCSIYYECIHGESVRRHCPSGEEFDDNQRKCVPAGEAVCSTGSVTVPPISTATTPVAINCPPGNAVKDIPHETNCELYYRCENGTKHIRKCNSGLYFDEIMGMCTWAEDVYCGSRATTVSRSTTTILSDTDSTDDISLTECPPKGSHENRTLPHDCSCVKYYLCIDGEAYLRYCENGTEYDYVRRICDDPKNFNCLRPVPGLTTTSTTSTTTTTTTTPTTTTTTTPTTTTTTTPTTTTTTTPTTTTTTTPTTTTTTTPTTTTTTTPTTTTTTTPTTTTTTTSTTTTPTTTTTTTPTTTTTTTPTTTTTTTPTTTTTTTSTTTTTPKYTPGANYCSSWGDRKKIRHETKCEFYYVCINGYKILRKCLQGHYFNEIIEECDLPENTNCKNHVVEECESHYTCMIRYPDLEDCSSYYQCDNGVKVHLKCHKGLKFNPSTQMCDLPEYVNCNNSIDCSDPNSTGKTYPHECQCDKYYLCDHGDTKLRHCDPGFYYDRKKHKCDKAENVICDKSPNNKTQDARGCIGTCPVHDSEHRLPVTYLPHKDCTKFCYCNNGTPTAYGCSKGLHFSETDQKCTDPVKAQCVSSLTYDDGDQESTNAKETSFLSNIPLIGKLFR